MSVQILTFLHPFKHNDFVRSFCSKSLIISPRPKISHMNSKEDRTTLKDSGDAKFVHTCHNTPIEKLAQIIKKQLKENGVMLCERCQMKIIEAITKSINNIDHDKGKLPKQTETIKVEHCMKLMHRDSQEPSPYQVEKSNNIKGTTFNHLGKNMSLQPFEFEKNRVFDTKVVKDPPVLNSSPNVDITIVERKSNDERKIKDQTLGETVKKVMSVGVGPLPDVPLQSFTLTDMLHKIREKNEKCCKEHGITIQELEPALVAETESNMGKQPCWPPLGPPPVIQPLPHSTSPRYGPPICPKPIKRKSKSGPRNNPCKKCLNAHTCYCNCYGPLQANETESRKQCYKYYKHETNSQKQSYPYSQADEKYQQIYGNSVKAQPYQPKSFVKHLLKINCNIDKINNSESNSKKVK